MEKSSRIFVAGHRGLVGSAIVRLLESRGYREPLKATSAELDITDQQQVARWFEERKPENGMLAEAKAASAKSMVVWGWGRARRELMLSDDLAEACLLLITAQWDEVKRAMPNERLPLLNAGTGVDISIAELARLVCEIVGYKGELS